MLAAPQQRFEKNDLEVGPRNRQRYPRQPRPAPDVHHPVARIQELADRGTVQQMTVPQPADLARAEQSAFHSGRHQQVGISLRDIET